MSNTNERAAFESWYAKHCTESGFTMEPSEVQELREDDHYGNHRAVLNGKWEGWKAKAQQVAVPMLADSILKAARECKDIYSLISIKEMVQFTRAIEAHHGMGCNEQAVEPARRSKTIDKAKWVNDLQVRAVFENYDEAQQVAAPMSADDIYQLAQRGAVNDGLTAIVREVEAHHKIKPQGDKL